MSKPTPFETICRSVSGGMDPEELLLALERAAELRTDFEGLFAHILTEREGWIVGFLTGYEVGKMVEESK